MTNAKCNDPECATCRARESKIDWAKPVEHLYNNNNGIPSKSQVRVLAHGVRSMRPGFTTLVSVAATKRDILVYVNPATGEGRSAKNDFRYLFRNVPERVEVVSFINVYHNGPKNPDLLAPWDTKDEADENNIFSSRDCCVKLTATKQPSGSWTAYAYIVGDIKGASL